MRYLEETLNIKVSYENWDGQDSLPYLLLDTYSFKVAVLNGIRTLFIYPKEDIEAISTVKKNLGVIVKIADIPLVLILKRCTARERSALIYKNIPFIVEGKQIYLPFMGMLLQESYSQPSFKRDSLSPSAQLLLFYYIYKGCGELEMAHLGEKLGITAMSVTRAVKELEEFGLVSTHKRGVNKIITSELRGNELYKKAEKVLRSPVKKAGYLDKGILKEAVQAGETALSEMGMLNPPTVNTFAVHRLPDGCPPLEETLTDEDEQDRVEVWSYDPRVLAKDGNVDVLSLHQTLKNENDERIQIELDRILKEI